LNKINLEEINDLSDIKDHNNVNYFPKKSNSVINLHSNINNIKNNNEKIFIK
jgi:hypothetical protein